MVSNHAKTKYLGVLRSGGIQCNHFQVFGYRSLNHCLLHGFTFMALFSGWIMAIYLSQVSQQWHIYSNADNRR